MSATAAPTKSAAKSAPLVAPKAAPKTAAKPTAKAVAADASPMSRGVVQVLTQHYAKSGAAPINQERIAAELHVSWEDLIQRESLTDAVKALKKQGRVAISGCGKSAKVTLA